MNTVTQKTYLYARVSCLLLPIKNVKLSYLSSYLICNLAVILRWLVFNANSGYLMNSICLRRLIYRRPSHRKLLVYALKNFNTPQTQTLVVVDCQCKYAILDHSKSPPPDRTKALGFPKPKDLRCGQLGWIQRPTPLNNFF